MTPPPPTATPTATTTTTTNAQIIYALCALADGDYLHATGLWRELLDSSSSSLPSTSGGGHEEMITANLALSLLYSGRVDEARALLESLIEKGFAFPGLTFNLATVYELCADTARARGLKEGLARRVAEGAQGRVYGGEKEEEGGEGGEESGRERERPRKSVGRERTNADFKL